jgi:Tfp pilus assembly protein PilO
MLLVVAIVAMGWFLGVSPKLAEAATAGQQKAAAEAQNVVHESEIAVIKKQFDQLPALKSQLAVLRAAVPEGSGMSAFLDELHAL